MMDIRRGIAWALAAVFAAGALGGCLSAGSAENPHNVRLSDKNPVTVTVWHYYNGGQQEAFNSLVSEFNDTEGRETGIVVESFSQGSVTDLESTVLDSVNKKVGASAMPNLFAAYPDTAFAVDRLGFAVDLDPYLSEEEKASFIESYLEEGRFTEESGLKIFPVAKSTEVFTVNKTDWDVFAAETGTSVDDMATIEGLTRVSQRYYEWTDAETPDTPHDGKAFFGRDVMANYMFTGMKQMGVDIVSVEGGEPVLRFDKDKVRRLWDNYYVPYIHGYFDASGRFRSDDLKTGRIIGFVGSSSSVTYFPTEVILDDTESYPIEMMALPSPRFEGGDAVAVQQGAGFVVNQTTDEEVYASVQFLKWLAQDERNIRFSSASGYMPVTQAANDVALIRETTGGVYDDRTLAALEVSIGTVKESLMYTPKAFEQGTAVRAVLEHSMQDLAAQDREQVLAMLAAGKTMDEALAEYISDGYFDAWYDGVREELERLVS